jgi:hypothetical protein
VRCTCGKGVFGLQKRWLCDQSTRRLACAIHDVRARRPRHGSARATPSRSSPRSRRRRSSARLRTHSGSGATCSVRTARSNSASGSSRLSSSHVTLTQSTRDVRSLSLTRHRLLAGAREVGHAQSPSSHGRFHAPRAPRLV